MSRRILLLLLSLTLMLALSGCGTMQPKVTTGSFVATIEVPEPTVTPAGLRKPIKSIKGTIGSKSVTVTPVDGVAVLSFSDLPMGPYTFSATAYDTANVNVLSGSQAIIIEPGKTTTATVALTPTGYGSVRVNVDTTQLQVVAAPMSQAWMKVVWVEGTGESKYGLQMTTMSSWSSSAVVVLGSIRPTSIVVFVEVRDASGQVLWAGQAEGEVYQNETTAFNMVATTTQSWLGNASVSGVISPAPDAPTSVSAQRNIDNSVTFTFTPSVDTVESYVAIALPTDTSNLVNTQSHITQSGQSIPYQTAWQGKTVRFALVSKAKTGAGKDIYGYMSNFSEVSFP
jgi:hypothetical protein